jgi:hypothetical protein
MDLAETLNGKGSREVAQSQDLVITERLSSNSIPPSSLRNHEKH